MLHNPMQSDGPKVGTAYCLQRW